MFVDISWGSKLLPAALALCAVMGDHYLAIRPDVFRTIAATSAPALYDAMRAVRIETAAFTQGRSLTLLEWGRLTVFLRIAAAVGRIEDLRSVRQGLEEEAAALEAAALRAELRRRRHSSRRP